MDQNEEIFVRYMNDPEFRSVVTDRLASEAYRRLQAAPDEVGAVAAAGGARGLRLVEGRPEDRYVDCLPLVPLAAAAGAFSGPQDAGAQDDWQWVAAHPKHRPRPGMFVAQVAGKSMEPVVPDGAYGLFRAPVEGARQGKIVLVELRGAADPETGARYTVKRYESEKVPAGDSWRHAAITLKPINPAFEPIVLTAADAEACDVVAELVDLMPDS